MKKQSLLLLACGLFVVASFSSCLWHHRHHSSITISESGDEYQLSASFDKNKSRKIQRLLDRELGRDYDASFQNECVDGEISLHDRTVFYIRSLPGRLKIVFDKSENSEESGEKIRELCEDIKDALEDN